MEQIATEQEQRDRLIAQLTSAMAAGSEDACRRLYELIFDRLYRLLLLRTRGDENLARELIQSVLLRLAKYTIVFSTESKLWAWLKQTARSVHVDWLRSNTRHGGLERIELGDEVEAALITYDESDEQMLELLEQSVSGLEKGDRELIRLVYYEHMPQRTLAEKWQTSVKAIESKLARVRQKLRKTLLERMKDYALL